MLLCPFYLNICEILTLSPTPCIAKYGGNWLNLLYLDMKMNGEKADSSGFASSSFSDVCDRFCPCRLYPHLVFSMVTLAAVYLTLGTLMLLIKF